MGRALMENGEARSTLCKRGPEVGESRQVERRAFEVQAGCGHSGNRRQML